MQGGVWKQDDSAGSDAPCLMCGGVRGDGWKSGSGLCGKATEERFLGAVDVESEGSVQVFAAGDLVVEQLGRALALTGA